MSIVRPKSPGPDWTVFQPDIWFMIPEWFLLCSMINFNALAIVKKFGSIEFFLSPFIFFCVYLLLICHRGLFLFSCKLHLSFDFVTIGDDFFICFFVGFCLKILVVSLVFIVNFVVF